MNEIALAASIFSLAVSSWIAGKSHRFVKFLAISVAIVSVIPLYDNYKSSKDEAEFQKAMRLKAEETLKRVTGSVGYPKVALDKDVAINKQGLLAIHNENDLPLYNIIFLIIDIEHSRYLMTQGLSQQQALFKAGFKIGPLNLGPSQSYVKPISLPHSETSVGLAINVTTRNGAWFQELRYRRTNDKKWAQAYRVKDFMKKNKIVTEMVDADYPRDQKGVPIW